MSSLFRPQPIGIFSLPQNFLLLPACNVEDAVAYHAQLMQGKIPALTPPLNWQFYDVAIRGELTQAANLLANENSPEAKFNAFVVQSSPEKYQQLRNELPAEILPLLDLVAYTLNYISAPPVAANLDGELLAFVQMTAASHCIENGEAEKALEILQEAINAARNVSPMLTAQLMGSLAELQHQLYGANPPVIQLYRQALQLLSLSDLQPARASIALNLGIAYQEMSQGQRGALLEAARCYQEALKFFGRESHPEQYALAQNNLALSYLSVPMTEASDQLRLAIAVQALREVLKVYTQESHPEQWASVQLNLANALQYLPTSHPEENLSEAVKIYEELLPIRKASGDALGLARLLANQGNALAHLGIFKHAVPKLEEARAIFAAQNEADAAASIDEVLAEISEQQQTASAAS
ncbi:MAG: hypothetical protein JST84_23160 [Acidobacteria bacterium]|nr:hypothetical protein [Acidobacteriota bacterium]